MEDKDQMQNKGMVVWARGLAPLTIHIVPRDGDEPFDETGMDTVSIALVRSLAPKQVAFLSGNLLHRLRIELLSAEAKDVFADNQGLAVRLYPEPLRMDVAPFDINKKDKSDEDELHRVVADGDFIRLDEPILKADDEDDDEDDIL